MTPTNLFQMALRQVGVLGRGQNVSAEQLSDALTLCNMMLGQWARKRWLVFHLLELFATGSGKSPLLLGPPGNSDFAIFWDDPNVTWNQSGVTFDQSWRVNRIERAFVRINAGVLSQTDLPLSIIPSYEDWSAMPIKLMTAGFPQTVYLDPGYPIAKLYVWPAPTSTYQIHILILNPLIRLDPSVLAIDLNLPDEYQDAIFWNLCRRLLNSYRKPPDQEIHAQAAAALNTVKNANFQLPALRMPPGLVKPGNYNIYSDSYT